jgi:hypothetical protein
MSESNDRDVLARGQRRRSHRLANVGLQGKRELFVQIVLPRQRALFLGICVDDHFHLDAMFDVHVPG